MKSKPKNRVKANKPNQKSKKKDAICGDGTLHMFPHSVECRGKLKIVKIRRQQKIDAATATKKKKERRRREKQINQC